MTSTDKRYAAGTTVPAERTQGEIQNTLRRYGADGFVFGLDGDRALIGFRVGARQVRFILDFPTIDDPQFARTGQNRARTTAAREQAYEAEIRRRWRALLLAIKAKLEVVASGIATFDEEFLAHLVLPGGSTVGERVIAEIDEAAALGQAPPRLLPALGASS